MKRTYLALATAGLFATALPAAAGTFDLGSAEETVSGVRFSGLLDMRVVRTSKRRSWLYNAYNLQSGAPVGPENKLRYGGKDINADEVGDRRANQFAFPQASLVLEAPVAPVSTLHLQANFDADSDSGNGSAGLVELYSDSEWGGEKHALRLRLGAYIPPLSWEHPETAWSTRYTLTPSAIGSWAGEDLRAFGGELSWRWQLFANDHLRLTGGGFSGSDQSGWVLLERGWAMHDFQPDLNFAYKLQSFKDGAVVMNRPFKEFDSRAGYYGRTEATFLGGLLTVGGGAWDNNADIRVQTRGSHLDVYHTDFRDVGAKIEYRRLVLIGQRLHGNVESLAFPIRSYNAGFILAAYSFWRLQAAGRWDRFDVEQIYDNGTALTGALTYRLAPGQRLTAEHVMNDVDAFGAANPDKTADRLTSLNYRILF